MSAVAISPNEAHEITEGFWARVGRHLKNWGAAAVSAAKKVGGWIKSAARWLWSKAGSAATWLWNTTPVQWVIGKTTALAATPVGKVALGTAGAVGAVILAPKVLIGAGLVVAGGLAYIAWRGHRAVKKYGQEKLDRYYERVDEAMDELNGIEFDAPPTAAETIKDRMMFLDRQMTLVAKQSNKGAYSELIGRLWLCEVRANKHSKLKANASVSVIYRELRRDCESRYPDFEWVWDRMYRAVKSEDKRLKDLERLHQDQAAV